MILMFFSLHESLSSDYSDRLRNVVESDFAQITYSEAIDILHSEIAAGNVIFEKYPNWGDDLGSEHERYITEKVRLIYRIIQINFIMFSLDF